MEGVEIAGSITDLLTFLGAAILFVLWYTKTYRKEHRFAKFFGRRCRRVVVVTSHVPPERHGRHEFSGTQPKNILLTPVSEGAALARIYLCITDAVRPPLLLRHKNPGHDPVEVIPPDQFREQDSAPFVTIGGPNINDQTKRILRSRAEEFSIKHPEHLVTIWGKRLRDPNGDPSGMHDVRTQSLVEDFGFILTGKLGGRRYIALLGTYAFGTLIAARALLEMGKNQVFTREERKRFARGDEMLIGVKARVENYQISRTIERIDPDKDCYSKRIRFWRLRLWLSEKISP